MCPSNQGSEAPIPTSVSMSGRSACSDLDASLLEKLLRQHIGNINFLGISANKKEILNNFDMWRDLYKLTGRLCFKKKLVDSVFTNVANDAKLQSKWAPRALKSDEKESWAAQNSKRFRAQCRMLSQKQCKPPIPHWLQQLMNSGVSLSADAHADAQDWDDEEAGECEEEDEEEEEKEDVIPEGYTYGYDLTTQLGYRIHVLDKKQKTNRRRLDGSRC